MIKYTNKEKNMDLKHYVTFLSYGELKPNENTREVWTNDIVLNVPDSAFGFKTYDMASEDIYKDGKKVVSKDEVLNEKLYYIGEIATLEDIIKAHGEDSLVYKNLIKAGAYGAVKARQGFYIPLVSNQKVHLLTPEDLVLKVSFDDKSYYNLTQQEKED